MEALSGEGAPAKTPPLDGDRNARTNRTLPERDQESRVVASGSAPGRAGVATIADVLREEQVLVTCPHCNVVVQYERHQFEGKFAPETLVPEAEARLRCKHCGGRGGRISGQRRWRLERRVV